MKRLKVTLEKSTIGRPERQRKIVKALGLRKRQSSRVLEDTPSIRGMVAKVGHLLRVEEVTE